MRFPSQSSVTVNPMSPRDLDLAIEWAAREGWNPGLDDAACFYPADPEGFFIAYSGKTPVGTISAVRYGDDFGFIGLFLVTPERRGRQIGLVLADTAIRAHDLDEAKAIEAQQRTEESLKTRRTNVNYAAAEAELMQSVARLKNVAGKHRRDGV